MLTNLKTSICGMFGILALIASKFFPEYTTELLQIASVCFGGGLLAAADAKKNVHN